MSLKQMPLTILFIKEVLRANAAGEQHGPGFVAEVELDDVMRKDFKFGNQLFAGHAKRGLSSDIRLLLMIGQI